MPLKLQTIICSTRPGRLGTSVARWFHDFATSYGGFDTELIDLAEFNLPVYNEPRHPRLAQYEHEHTKRWSESVSAADAYVFVTPEYNHSPVPALVNALNYIYKEWNYKPCGFVSYGGVSGGLRAVQATKMMVTTLKMMPMVEIVAIPMVQKQIEKNGDFSSNKLIDDSARTMLEELLRWAEALKPLHA